MTNKKYWLDVAFKQCNYKFTSDKITYDEFLAVISKNTYSLQELGMSAGGMSNLLKRIFPDRISTHGRDKVCNFLLSKINKKVCSKCTLVLETSSFHSNSSKKGNINSWCIACDKTYRKTNPEFTRASSSRYRAAKLQRTVLFDQEGIESFYANCPAGHHVDHIIPLQGINVCGLHVLSNLQYLSARDNIVKSNKHNTTESEW